MVYDFYLIKNFDFGRWWNIKWGFMIKVFLFGSMVGCEFVKEFNCVYLIFIFIIIMFLVLYFYDKFFELSMYMCRFVLVFFVLVCLIV